MRDTLTTFVIVVFRLHHFLLLTSGFVYPIQIALLPEVSEKTGLLFLPWCAYYRRALSWLESDFVPITVYLSNVVFISLWKWVRPPFVSNCRECNCLLLRCEANRIHFICQTKHPGLSRLEILNHSRCHWVFVQWYWTNCSTA